MKGYLSAISSFCILYNTINVALAFDSSCTASRSLRCHVLSGTCSGVSFDYVHHITIPDNNSRLVSVKQCTKNGYCSMDEKFYFNYKSRVASDPMGISFSFNDDYTEYKRSSIIFDKLNPEHKDLLFIEYGKCVRISG
jgi:hypothetical protein